MSGRLSRPIGLATLVALTWGEGALAQSPAPAPAPQDSRSAAAPVASTAPAAPASAASSAAGYPATSAGAPTTTPAVPPSTAAAASAKEGTVTGYAYGTKKPPAPSGPSESHTPRHGKLVHHANEAVATFTGFEMLADGGSRLFVQLSRQVDVDQAKGATSAAPPAHTSKKHPGKGRKSAAPATVTTLTFVLKGTEVVKRNNENALVTVHFNTPVTRARLLPSGHDLRLLVDLRADVTPTMKVVPAKDDGAMLQIDFPAGSYLPAGEEAGSDSDVASPTSTSTSGSGTGGAAASSQAGAATTDAPSAAEDPDALESPAPATSGSSGEPLEAESGVRFRWGITPMGGAMYGGVSGGAGGLDMRFGAQISPLFGLYLQPSLIIGVGVGANESGSSASVLALYGVGALADFTFGDTFFVGLGPEVLSGGLANATTVGNTQTTTQTSTQTVQGASSRSPSAPESCSARRRRCGAKGSRSASTCVRSSPLRRRR